MSESSDYNGEEQDNNQHKKEESDGATVLITEQTPKKSAEEYDYYEHKEIDLELTGLNDRWSCDMLYNEKTDLTQYEFKRDDGVRIEILEMPKKAINQKDEVKRWGVASLDLDCAYYSRFGSEMMYSDSIWQAVQTVRIITVNIAHLDADEFNRMKNASPHK